MDNIDILPAVKSMELKKGVSKAGNEYFYILVTYINNYQGRYFLNADSTFAIKNACDVASKVGMAPSVDDTKAEQARKDFWS